MLQPLWRDRLARVARCLLTDAIAAFRAQGSLGQLSANNCHNRRLFDHLGCAQQDRGGHGKTKRLGGLEVQDHLEFHGKLHVSTPE